MANYFVGNYLSQELQIPVPYLIKFSSFLYEVQLLKLRNQTWTMPEDIDFDRDNITDSVEIRDSGEERGETTEEEREVLSNLNMLQTKLLEGKIILLLFIIIYQHNF